MDGGPRAGDWTSRWSRYSEDVRGDPKRRCDPNATKPDHHPGPDEISPHPRGTQCIVASRSVEIAVVFIPFPQMADAEDVER